MYGQQKVVEDYRCNRCGRVAQIIRRTQSPDGVWIDARDDPPIPSGWARVTRISGSGIIHEMVCAIHPTIKDNGT